MSSDAMHDHGNLLRRYRCRGVVVYALNAELEGFDGSGLADLIITTQGKDCPVLLYGATAVIRRELMHRGLPVTLRAEFDPAGCMAILKNWCADEQARAAAGPA